MAQDEPVEPDRREEREVDDRCRGDRERDRGGELGRHGALEARVVGDERRHGDDGGVEHVEREAEEPAALARRGEDAGGEAHRAATFITLRDGGDDVVDVAVGKGRVHEEGERGLVGARRSAKPRRRGQPGSRERLLAVDLGARAVLHRHALGLDGEEHPVAVPALRQLRGHDMGVEAVEGVLAVLGRLRDADAADAGEAARKPGGELRAARVRRGQLELARADHGGLQLRQAVVRAEAVADPPEAGGTSHELGVVRLRERPAVVAVLPGARERGVVIECYQAAFAGRHDLVLAEGEARGVAERADGLAAIHSPVRLRAVLDHDDPALAGQAKDRVHLGGPASEVDDDDRGGASGQGRLEGPGGEVRALGVDVGEGRRGADGHDAARGRDEAARRHDDLVSGADAESAQRQLECQGAVGDGECMSAAELLRVFALQRAAFLAGPVVDPARAQDVGDRLDLRVGRRGPSRHRCRADRSAAVDGELLSHGPAIRASP